MKSMFTAIGCWCCLSSCVFGQKEKAPMRNVADVYQRLLKQFDVNHDFRLDINEFSRVPIDDRKRIVPNNWALWNRELLSSGSFDWNEDSGEIITSDGLALACRLFVHPKKMDADRTPIVLIHDAHGQGEDLYPLARQLRDRHDRFVVVPDLRGHGHTRWLDARRPPIKPVQWTAADVGRTVHIDLQAVRDLLEQLNDRRLLNIAKLTVGGAGTGAVIAVADASERQRWPAQALILIAPLDNYKGVTIRQLADRWFERCRTPIYFLSDDDERGPNAEAGERVSALLTRNCGGDAKQAFFEEHIRWVTDVRRWTESAESLRIVDSMNTFVHRELIVRNPGTTLAWKRIKEDTSSGGGGGGTFRTIIIRVPR